jgi:hypothetical protein
MCIQAMSRTTVYISSSVAAEILVIGSFFLLLEVPLSSKQLVLMKAKGLFGTCEKICSCIFSVKLNRCEISGFQTSL